MPNTITALGIDADGDLWLMMRDPQVRSTRDSSRTFC